MSWKDGRNSKDDNTFIRDVTDPNYQKTLKKATYRIVRFPKLEKFIGIAWNYEEAVLVSTTPQDTYTLAREQLQQDCSIVGVELRWFDGEYCYDSNTGQLVNYVGSGSGKSSITGTEENRASN